MSGESEKEPEVVTKVEGTRVWVGISQKVRTGKYETIEISMGASTTADPKQIKSSLRKLAAKVREEEKELLDLLREEEGV